MPDGTSSSLSQVKISELPVAPTVNDADQLEANQAGTSRSITVAQIKAAVPLPPLGVPAERFGAVGDGVHDDTVALQAGIDFLFARGGGVLALTGRYLIDSANLVVKDRVFLQGTLENFGAPSLGSTWDYSTVHSCLVVNSAYTISCTGMSGGLCGLAILRKGLTVPTDLASGQALKLTLASGGTAVSLGDGSGRGADFYLGHLFIAGFNYGIYSNYADRYRIEYICGHNWSEIFSSHTYDLGHINNCHFWPFLVAGQSWTLTGDVWRTYRGVLLDTGTDGTVVTDVFTYGKSVAFENNTDFVKYIGCWADNLSTGTYAGTVGFQITWPAKATQIIGCATSQHDNGVVIDTHSTPYAGDTTMISGSNFTDNVSNNVLITNGHAIVHGNTIGNSANGINIQSALGTVYWENVFDSVTNPVVIATAARATTQAGGNMFARCTDPFGSRLLGPISFAGPDNAVRVLIAGDSHAIRIGTTATGASIEGIDNTGVGSFQPLTLNGSIVNVTPIAVFNSEVQVTGANATYRQFSLQTAGSNRWTMGVTNVGESGGNVGSDFALYRFDDTGNFIEQSFSLQRSTGLAAFARGIWVAFSAAVTAGSNTQAFVKASATPNLGLYYGTGAPTFTAAANSLYMRTDGNSTTTRMYVNTTGSTTWATVTTSA